jgi:aminomethyltransferase
LQKIVQLQNYHERNGHITDFAGFSLPLWFKGIVPESLAVRNAAGIFDVSHMGRAIVRGTGSQQFLDLVTTNDVSSLKNGQGQYTLLCNPKGGIIDDLTVFRLQEDEYLVVYNAGNRQKDYDWIMNHSRGLDASVEDISDKAAMFAVQGPKARGLVQSLAESDLTLIPRFGWAWTTIRGVKALITRTGYTGEDGFEIYVWDAPLDNPSNAESVWNAIIEAGRSSGLEPCGLGARDVLRLEAGLCLYGTDMNEKTNPYEARLSFVVKLTKNFIGKERLQQIKETGTSRVRIGLVTEKRVPPRHGFLVASKGRPVGSVTSGTLSPLLNTGIAMAYVEREVAQEGTALEIKVRNRMEGAKVVKPPFYDTARFGYARKT